MERIKKGEVKIKPRSYYLMIGFLSISAVLALSFISAYFMSVTSLWFRLQLAKGPAYGVRNNLSDLLSSFPWLVLIVGVISLVCMILAIKKIGSLYKIRLVYLIPSIIILFLMIGFLLSYSALPKMFDGGHRNFGRQSTNIESYRH